MKIDNDTIKYIANLAMIQLDKDEEEKYAKALGQILTYTEVLNEINVDNISEDSSLVKEYNKFRKDEIKQPLDRDVILSNAPDSEGGLLKIPKTI
ncbi:MAG: Asp-tRNA(Asn)/Glu-tRNA(Gln) amidotransferase subunit GatC [Clostridia bacterium]|nr:Asp-tRNA(Asn)/Glu-tRNA(Gln) amidotransferase subunit GatC [Clostridia bacterium]